MRPGQGQPRRHPRNRHRQEVRTDKRFISNTNIRITQNIIHSHTWKLNFKYFTNFYVVTPELKPDFETLYPLINYPQN
jgi:hypothetical protein